MKESWNTQKWNKNKALIVDLSSRNKSLCCSNTDWRKRKGGEKTVSIAIVLNMQSSQLKRYIFFIVRNLLPLRDAIYIFGSPSLAGDSTSLHIAVFPLNKVTYPELSYSNIGVLIWERLPQLCICTEECWPLLISEGLWNLSCNCSEWLQ